MQLPEPLEKRWLAVMRMAQRLLTINEEGVTLGKTVIAPFVHGELAIDASRIATLLSVAYGSPVAGKVADNFRHAARCYKDGKVSLAHMHLALTGLHAIDLEAAQRLFVAEWAMENGVTAKQLLKFAGIVRKGDDEDDDESEDEGDDDSESDDNDDSDTSGFDSKHPRWPAGSPGGIGGEFAPKDAGDATGALHDALAEAANVATSAANRVGAETADDIKFPNEAIDSDPIGGLLLPAAATYGGLEALGSDAAASIAAQARAALASAMAAVGNMGTAAADKAQELYESMENALNSWLQDNDSFLPERNNTPNLISSTLQEPSSQTLQGKIIGPMQPFEEDDLVYGPSANGSLKILADEQGGTMLTDLEKPANLSVIQFSTKLLQNAALTGQQVRFDLTNMSDIDQVMAGHGQYANTVTGVELRYIMNNWDTFTTKPKFYYDGWEVLAPWIK